jgi:hypothetical protein
MVFPLFPDGVVIKNRVFRGENREQLLLNRLQTFSLVQNSVFHGRILGVR